MKRLRLTNVEKYAIDLVSFAFEVPEEELTLEVELSSLDGEKEWDGGAFRSTRKDLLAMNLHGLSNLSDEKMEQILSGTIGDLALMIEEDIKSDVISSVAQLLGVPIEDITMETPLNVMFYQGGFVAVDESTKKAIFISAHSAMTAPKVKHLIDHVLAWSWVNDYGIGITRG